jgi:hypothetical protein
VGVKDTDTNDNFVYTPVWNYYFRILEITSVKPQFNARLEKYSLLAPPEYHAISYSWQGTALLRAIFPLASRG